VPDYTQNPFSLYEYAITKNEPGKVNIHPVTYRLRDIELTATVYTPPNYDPDCKFPAITVVYPNGGVKEQVAGRYTQRLAEQGYITIAADAAYQGPSSGEPAPWTSRSSAPTTCTALRSSSPASPGRPRTVSQRWASAAAADTRST
jgi:dienelactone hydrolase